MINEDQLKVVQAQHNEWLGHPTTKMVLKFLENEVERQGELTASLASDYTEFTGDKLQRYAMRSQTLITLKKAIYDPTILIAGAERTSE